MNWFGFVVGSVVAVLIIRVGLFVIRGLANPLPPPLPPGEMRRVKIVYRCESCGLEIRTTLSPTEDPAPPRHCMDEMSLVAADDI